MVMINLSVINANSRLLLIRNPTQRWQAVKLAQPFSEIFSSSAQFPLFMDLQSNYEYPFEAFHYLDQHSNPMLGVQTGSNFDSFDVFPSPNMEFFDYECKPFADGQAMEHFHGGGGGFLMNFPVRNSNNHHPIGLIGTSNPLSLQEIKPVNFVVPDEVSCVTAANNQDYCKNIGMNRNRIIPSDSTRRSWKNRKKNHVVKGQWTIDEDRLLIKLVEQHGLRKWSHIAQMLPGRIGKQCRERWHNHLRPDIKKDIWSEEEDKVLIEAHTEIGNKWAEIAKRLPGRTENSIKNHWNATKRRQYSKRKCRSKYPRGSLLQDYIKSLNLDSTTGRCYQGKTTTASGAVSGRGVKAAKQQQQAQALALCYDFNEVPDFDFDEKMFQEGCSIDSLLDDIPCAAIVADLDIDDVAAADVAPSLLGDFEVKKELDLVEMMSQGEV